jgi:hypothetical protein
MRSTGQAPLRKAKRGPVEGRDPLWDSPDHRDASTPLTRFLTKKRAWKSWT